MRVTPERQRDMNVAVMKNKAEQSFAEQFEKSADELPGDAAVRRARKAAIGRFAAVGLPHRRVEEWKYTDLRALMKEAYAVTPQAAVSGEQLVAGALGEALSALDAVRIVLVNGRFEPSLSQLDAARGSTYHFEPTASGLNATEGFAWLKDRMADTEGAKADALVALNTAFARDGATLWIEAGSKIAKPFHFVFISSAEQPAAEFTRSFIGVGAGARATLIESHIALGPAGRQTNSVAEIAVHDGAQLSHIKITRGAAATHIGSSIIDLDADALYHGFQYTAESGLVRNQTFVTFKGEGSKIDLSGAFLVRNNEHVDTTMVVDHAVPRCESRELFKGVLDDRARGIFQGKVIVRPDAQKTDGKQMAQALMLSPDAEFDSKPELEIYADDVVCGHGTTSAELDTDLLFYCKSRGIPENEARALLIESFIGESLDKVEHEGVRAALQAMAFAWLAKSEI